MLSEEEVKELRDGLKAKWNELNAKYLRKAYVRQVDTVGARREKLGL